MADTATLIFSRSDVERLLTLDECIAAVEDAFAQHAQGKTSPPGVLGMHAEDGGFHIKAALLTLDRPYFAARPMAISRKTARVMACRQSRVSLCSAMQATVSRSR